MSLRAAGQRESKCFASSSGFGIGFAVCLVSSLTACVADPADQPGREQERAAEPRSLAAASMLPTPHATGALIELGSAAVELHTAAAWRGDTALDVAIVGTQQPAPDMVATVRAGFVELVQVGGDWAEQSWRFDQAPGAAGDLTIAVGMTGLDYAASDPGGLLLRRSGEFGVHYSHGTWVDAKGSRWAVPARFELGRILLTVPSDVVAHSAYPAVLDPIMIVTPL